MPPAGGTAVVFSAPAAYLYLARQVLRTLKSLSVADALPLSTEPFAAALDLFFLAIAKARSRARRSFASPHWSFPSRPADDRQDWRPRISSPRVKYVAGGSRGRRARIARVARTDSRGGARRGGSASTRCAPRRWPRPNCGDDDPVSASGSVCATVVIAAHERLPPPTSLVWAASSCACAVLAAPESLREAHRVTTMRPFLCHSAEHRAALDRGQTFAPRPGSGVTADAPPPPTPISTRLTGGPRRFRLARPQPPQHLLSTVIARPTWLAHRHRPSRGRARPLSGSVAAGSCPGLGLHLHARGRRDRARVGVSRRSGNGWSAG